MTIRVRRVARAVVGVLAAVVIDGLASLRGQPAITAWRVTEVWRTDGGEGGQPLADPRDLIATKDGTLWVLDFKDQRIRRFSAAGKPMASLGRLGSGPGEFRNANGFLLHPNGTVWINDPRNARLTVYSDAGQFLRQHTVSPWGWRYRWDGWVERATGAVADPVPAKSRYAFRMVAASGTIRDSVAQPSCPSGKAPPEASFKAEAKSKATGAVQGPYPFTTGGGAAATGHGTMWCADAGSTRAALVRIPTGDTIATTSIEVPTMTVPAAERDSVVNFLLTTTRKYDVSDFDPMRVRNSKPGIAMLTVDDDGRLWVQHAARFRAGNAVFDVHDARGQHLGRVTIPRPLYAQGYLPIKARGNDIWAVVIDDDEVPSVARYRIVR
jgi:hypothetical protein